MKCPIDDTTLVMTGRQGIEIDYCPHCRGVWLDRGELDKLIERAAPAQEQRPSPPRRLQPGTSPYDARPGEDRHHDQPRHGKRRESLLGELFDF